MTVGLATIYAELRSACERVGGQREWARRAGVSEQLVCDVLNARRDPSGKLLAALGYRKVIAFEETNRSAGLALRGTQALARLPPRARAQVLYEESDRLPASDARRGVLQREAARLQAEADENEQRQRGGARARRDGPRRAAKGEK